MCVERSFLQKRDSHTHPEHYPCTGIVFGERQTGFQVVDLPCMNYLTMVVDLRTIIVLSRKEKTCAGDCSKVVLLK